MATVKDQVTQLVDEDERVDRRLVCQVIFDNNFFYIGFDRPHPLTYLLGLQQE